MRKIEKEMLEAIRLRNTWHGKNTAVTPDTRQDGKLLAIVTLHGNHIATIGYEEDGTVLYYGKRVVSLSISLAGWNTATTRSRLSAIIREFAENGGHGLGVSTRKGDVWLSDAAGKRWITDAQWHIVYLRKEDVL